MNTATFRFTHEDSVVAFVEFKRFKGKVVHVGIAFVGESNIIPIAQYRNALNHAKQIL